MFWRHHFRALGLVLGLILCVVGVQADLASVPFSAEMIQRGPDGSTTTGRMHVDSGRMRVEMSQQGRPMIRITDQESRTEWILFPEEKRYIEHSVPAEVAAALGATAPDASPCAGMPGLTCRNLGEDTLAGRPVTKWEVTASHQGQSFTMVQWIDAERSIPLIQELPNGQRTELRFVKQETLDGRTVEKWETVVTAPNRPERRTFQWYDPELRLAIKQELPGGFVNELRDIKVGDQPEDLFIVPDDYTKISRPEAMASPPGAGSQR